MNLKVPEGTGFAFLCLFMGILMTSVAMVRIEAFPHRKAYQLRALTVLFLGVLFTAIDISWITGWYTHGGAGIMVTVNPPIGALMLTAFFLLLITPVFTTGELASFQARRFAKYLGWGWTKQGLKQGKLASGPSFILIATLLSLLFFCFSMTVTGHSQSISKCGALSLGLPGVPPPPTPTLTGKPGETVSVSGNAVSVVTSKGDSETVTPIPNGTFQDTKTRTSGQTTVTIVPTWPSNVPKVPQVKPVNPLDVPQTGDFAQGAIALVTGILGFSVFCMFLSVATRTRWIALLVAYVILGMILIMPEITLSYADAVHQPSAWVNLIYLNPVQPFFQMCDAAGYWPNRTLAFGHMPIWRVETIVWMIVGFLSFIGMLPFVKSIANENTPIPYEEQVQLT